MKHEQLIITDDLDGTPDAETRSFGYDGRTYEIDLGAVNSAKLDQVLAPYIEAARLTANGNGRRPTHRRGPKPGHGLGADAKTVRAWWAEHPDGLPTWQPRGAIPTLVLSAWRDRDNGNTVTDDSAAPAAPKRRRRSKAELAAA